MNHITNELSNVVLKELDMNKKTTVLQKIGYIILACIPAVCMTLITLCASLIKQFFLTIEYKNAGNDLSDVEGLTNYIMSYLQGENLLKIVAIGQIVAIVLGLLVMYLKLKKDAFGNPLKAFKALRFPGIVLAAIGIELLLSCALMTIATLFPGALDGYASMIETTGLADLTLISTLATVLLAPVCEEIVFRGLTLTILEKTKMNFWVINVIQAIIFGVAHGNVVQGVYAFLLGLFLGFVAYKCKSIWGSILAHAAFNFSGTYIVTLIFGNSEEASILLLVGVAAMAIVLSLLGLYLIAYKKKEVMANE